MGAKLFPKITSAGKIISPADVFIIVAEISICRLKAARVIQWKERVLVDREILVPEK
jgi:hypothetical protein